MKKIKLLQYSFLLVWVYPVFFLYAQNVKEVKFTEIFEASGILIICSIFIIVIGRLFFRSWEAAAIFSSLQGILLGNFMLFLNPIQKAFPQVRYWHLITIFLLLGFLIIKFMEKKINLIHNLLLLFCIVYSALILINSITAIPTIINKVNTIQKTDGKNDFNELSADTGAKRNIYYILCDEYASFEQLEKEFNYKNSDFENKLKELKFNISYTSANDCMSTRIVMTNIMSLDYLVNAETTAIEMESILADSYVKKLLVNQGYKLQGIGNTAWLGIEGTQNTAGGATTSEGETFTQLALAKTFLDPFIKRNYAGSARLIYESLVQLNNTDIIPDAAIFTLFYVCAPHHPYYFDRNGNPNPVSKYYNYEGENTDSYLGELEFLNKELSPALTRIIREDPNAIIILCSDHGNRFGITDESLGTKILNAVYYGGEAISDIEGKSGLNTLVYIFNNEFGLDLPYRAFPD